MRPQTIMGLAFDVAQTDRAIAEQFVARMQELSDSYEVLLRTEYGPLDDAGLSLLNRDCVLGTGRNVYQVLRTLLEVDHPCTDPRDLEHRETVLWPIYLRDIRRFGPRIRQEVL